MEKTDETSKAAAAQAQAAGADEESNKRAQHPTKAESMASTAAASTTCTTTNSSSSSTTGEIERDTWNSKHEIRHKEVQVTANQSIQPHPKEHSYLRTASKEQKRTGHLTATQAASEAAKRNSHHDQILRDEQMKAQLKQDTQYAAAMAVLNSSDEDDDDDDKDQRNIYQTATNVNQSTATLPGAQAITPGAQAVTPGVAAASSVSADATAMAIQREMQKQSDSQHHQQRVDNHSQHFTQRSNQIPNQMNKSNNNSAHSSTHSNNNNHNSGSHNTHTQNNNSSNNLPRVRRRQPRPRSRQQPRRNRSMDSQQSEASQQSHLTQSSGHSQKSQMEIEHEQIKNEAKYASVMAAANLTSVRSNHSQEEEKEKKDRGNDNNNNNSGSIHRSNHSTRTTGSLPPPQFEQASRALENKQQLFRQSEQESPPPSQIQQQHQQQQHQQQQQQEQPQIQDEMVKEKAKESAAAAAAAAADREETQHQQDNDTHQEMVELQSHASSSSTPAMFFRGSNNSRPALGSNDIEMLSEELNAVEPSTHTASHDDGNDDDDDDNFSAVPLPTTLQRQCGRDTVPQTRPGAVAVAPRVFADDPPPAAAAAVRDSTTSQLSALTGEYQDDEEAYDQWNDTLHSNGVATFAQDSNDFDSRDLDDIELPDNVVAAFGGIPEATPIRASIVHREEESKAKLQQLQQEMDAKQAEMAAMKRKLEEMERLQKEYNNLKHAVEGVAIAEPLFVATTDETIPVPPSPVAAVAKRPPQQQSIEASDRAAKESAKMARGMAYSSSSNAKPEKISALDASSTSHRGSARSSYRDSANHRPKGMSEAEYHAYQVLIGEKKEEKPIKNKSKQKEDPMKAEKEKAKAMLKIGGVAILPRIGKIQKQSSLQDMDATVKEVWKDGEMSHSLPENLNDDNEGRKTSTKQNKGLTSSATCGKDNRNVRVSGDLPSHHEEEEKLEIANNTRNDENRAAGDHMAARNYSSARNGNQVSSEFSRDASASASTDIVAESACCIIL